MSAWNKEKQIDYITLEIIKTLEFYANTDNYIINKDGRGVVIPDEDQRNIVTEDFGTRARELLKKVRA